MSPSIRKPRAAVIDPRLGRVPELIARVDALSLTDVDDGWRLAADGLRELVEADESFTLIAARRDDVPGTGSFAGWSPIKLCYAPDRPERRRMGERFRREGAATDDTLYRIASGCGAHRAYLRADQGTPEELAAAPSTAFMRALGVHDRLVSAHALDERIEVFFVFDRKTPDRPFTEADRAFLEQAMPALRRTCRWLALSHGAFPGQKLLSPREREALAHLLGPEPKKRIAAELGLTEGSLHQLAVRVYGKLGVSGRTELMALWLRPS